MAKVSRSWRVDGKELEWHLKGQKVARSDRETRWLLAKDLQDAHRRIGMLGRWVQRAVDSLQVYVGVHGRLPDGSADDLVKEATSGDLLDVVMLAEEEK